MAKWGNVDLTQLNGYEYYTAEGLAMSAGMYSEFVESMILTQGDTRLAENALGLCGEAGEAAEKIKKYFRDGVLDNAAVVKELGDVLFYVTALANHLGYDLQIVMDRNVEKLNSRKQRNQLQGSGDDR